MDQSNTLGVLTNSLNYDPVALMSLLMVVFAIVIIVFLYFKVKTLMKQDAEAHKDQPH